MSDAADAAVIAAEWAQRTQAEYTSAAIAHTATLWMLQLGAPPDLLRDGLRIVEDELTHSELSAEIAATVSPTTALALDPAQLQVAAAGDLVADLTAVIVRTFCVGETIAVPLFAMLSTDTVEPLAVSALARIRRDEARHRQFGWDVLDWLLLSHGPRVAPLVDELAWPSLDALVEAHEHGSTSSEVPSESARRWGLAARSRYAEVARRSAEQDVTPRFLARDVRPRTALP